MNSAVRLIFNESFIEKRGLWIQWTVHGIHWKNKKMPVHVLQKKKKKKAKTQMLVFFNCTQMDTKSIKQTKITIEIDSSYEKKSWNYNNKNKNRLT